MDGVPIYTPLPSAAFTSAGLERKSLADGFLEHFLASKVNDNKKKEIHDNLNSYTPFNSTDNKSVEANDDYRVIQKKCLRLQMM